MAKRVVVIGGGVVGMFVALEAARRGCGVTILERREQEHEGCSFGNAGTIVPSHFVPLAAPGMVSLGLRMMWNPRSPFYVRPRLSTELLGWGYKFWRACTRGHVEKSSPLLLALHLVSRRRYEEMAAATGNDIGLETRGLLMLCESERGLEEEAERGRESVAMGVPAEIVDSARAEQIEPALKARVKGGVYYPTDCHLPPQQLMRSLRRQAVEAGVECRWTTGVDGWRTQGSRVLAAVTSAGEVAGDEFVLCAGAWSSGLAKRLGLRLPLQPGKGYSLTLAAPPVLPRVPAILLEARVVVTPMGGTVRFGGTMELTGLDESINQERIAGMVDSVTRCLPGFSAATLAGATQWCGLRPCSPDGLPYVGRFGRFANLSAATGHAMLGMSLGPVTGQCMAQILCDEATEIDIRALSPDRYA